MDCFNALGAMKTIPQGAATTVFCATSRDVVPGEYYDDCRVGKRSAWAGDQAQGERLWELSEKLVAQGG